MTDIPNLSMLEQLLDETRDRATRRDCRALAETMSEALKLCESARTAQAAVHLQLQGVLAAIRAGHPDEAVALIERALSIGERWAGVSECATDSTSHT